MLDGGVSVAVGVRLPVEVAENCKMVAAPVVDESCITYTLVAPPGARASVGVVPPPLPELPQPTIPKMQLATVAASTTLKITPMVCFIKRSLVLLRRLGPLLAGRAFARIP